MKRRIVYATPDGSAASGGVRTIYRHVELLVEAGYDAAVWHAADGVALDWFESTAPVIHSEDLELTERDLVVIPECLVFSGVDPAPGCRKVIHNQNHFYTFRAAPFPDYPFWDPQPVVWASSRTIHEVMSRLTTMLPIAAVDVVPYTIDTDLFRPADARERKVTWMPRKRPDEAALIHALLAADRRLTDVVLHPIDGLSERRTAAELGTTSVFIALGRDEGFGLPVAEALAAGAAVVGYPSGGGAELFHAPGTHAVADSDVVAIADRVHDLLQDPPTAEDRQKYREWVAATYSGEGLRRALHQAVARAFSLPARGGRCRHPWPRFERDHQAVPAP